MARLRTPVAPASGDAASRRDLLVSGHINVDHFLRVDQFPARDRTVPVVGDRTVLGGTAATIARVAARYGVSVGLVSRLGEDFPPGFWRTLRAARIDLRGVATVPGEPTPTCYILEDGHHAQRTLIQQGPMGSAEGALPPQSVMNAYSWLHLTTGNPAWHLALAEAAQRSGTRIAADPAQEIHYLWDRGTLRRLLGGAEILFGNRHEIQRAVDLLGLRRPVDLLDHVPLVVRTEGRRGATAFSRVGTTEVVAKRPRRVASLVGSGDAFRGGFYAGWFAGEDLSHCLTAGTRAAAHWIERGSEAFATSPALPR